MADLHDTLETYVGNGSVPGAVGLVACGDRTEVAVVGSMAVDGVSMARDSIFRIASISTGTLAILLTQVPADSPVPPEWMRDFWRYAVGAC